MWKMSQVAEPTRYEEEVLDRVSELNARELSRLIAELGIEDEVKEEDRGKRVKLLKATMKYFVELEEDHADGGLAKFIQIHDFMTKTTSEGGLGLDTDTKDPNMSSVTMEGKNIEVEEFIRNHFNKAPLTFLGKHENKDPSDRRGEKSCQACRHFEN